MDYGKGAQRAGGRWNGRVDDVRSTRQARAPRRPRPVRLLQHLAGRDASAHDDGAVPGAQQSLAASTATAFNDTGTPYNSSHGSQFTGANAFTIEGWCKVNGSRGGPIAGFTTSPTSTPTTANRLVFVDSGGIWPWAFRPAA
jgi:hypothetical protein